MKKLSLCVFLLLYLCNYKIFAQKMTLESSSFKMNSLIPVEYTCNGADRSPPLSWHDAPEKTQSFALVVEDPDAENGVWFHWVLFNIPPTVTSLDAGAPVPTGAANAKNSWGGLGYRGPCPPFGAHRYVFKLYALDRILPLDNGASNEQALKAMTGHVLASAELGGIFQKAP